MFTDRHIFRDFETLNLLTALAGGKLTFHDFGDKPPRRVLDLGCGDGSWIISAVDVWKVTPLFV